MPDGRPQFFEVDPLQLGCNATFNGVGEGFSNAGTSGGPCDANLDPVTGANQAPLLTNGVEGTTKSFAIQFAKDFEFSDRTSLMIGLGYAHLDSEVGNPVNSSTAWSSYEEVAVEVLNDVRLGPSVWGNEHNIVLRAHFRHQWADGYPFSVGMFFQRRSGRAFSYAYEDDTVELYFGDSDDESRILVHVPTGPLDPLYDFSGLDPDDVTDLFAYLDFSGLSKYAGGIAPRNAFNSPWSSDLDIRIEQDFPLWSDHSLKLYLDIENALNLFTSSGNIKRFTHVDDVEEAARIFEIDQGNRNDPTAPINNTDQFEITRWYDDGLNWRLDADDSLYRIQLGVRYRF
jgi:hypothetical protein